MNFGIWMYILPATPINYGNMILIKQLDVDVSLFKILPRYPNPSQLNFINVIEQMLLFEAESLYPQSPGEIQGN